MINKKASSGITAFLNATLLYAIIIFIIFIIWTTSGGASVIANIGHYMAKVPGWAYVTIAVLWLFAALRK